MKNLKLITAYLFMIATIFMHACKDRDEHVTITDSIDVRYSEQPIPSTGGMLSVEIICNTDWEISTTSSWISSIEPRRGTGNGKAIVIFEENKGKNNRESELKIVAGTLKKTISIIQEWTGILNVSQMPLIFDAQITEKRVVQIESDREWKATANESWIVIHEDEDAISVTLNGNSSGLRKGVIDIKLTNSNQAISIPVYQGTFFEYKEYEKDEIVVYRHGEVEGAGMEKFTIELLGPLNLGQGYLTYLHLNGYTGLTDESSDFKLLPGLYKIEEKAEPMTLQRGVWIKNEETRDSYFDGSYEADRGSMADFAATIAELGFVIIEVEEIEGSKDNYTLYSVFETGDVVGQRVLPDAGIPRLIKFTKGTVLYKDERPRIMDVEISDFAGAYWGYGWGVKLSWGDVEADGLFGVKGQNGGMIDLDLILPTVSSIESPIPGGTYPLDPMGPGGTIRTQWSTYQLIKDGRKTESGQLFGGKIILTNEANGKYTLEFDVHTEDGKIRIKGKHSGEMRIVQ